MHTCAIRALSALVHRLGGVYLVPYSELVTTVVNITATPSRLRLHAAQLDAWQSLQRLVFAWDGSAHELDAVFSFGST